MIIVNIRIATNTDQSRLYEDLEMDNPEARYVQMRIKKSNVKMWCEAEDGGTDLWLVGDEISTPLEIPIRQFDKMMFPNIKEL